MVHRTTKAVVICRSIFARWALLLLLVGATPALAQRVPVGDAEYDAAFAAMQRTPADLDAIFRYTKEAIRVGNIEGAIGALERILIFNPDLPRVRLELGILYYRLGSLEIARAYID